MACPGYRIGPGYVFRQIWIAYPTAGVQVSELNPGTFGLSDENVLVKPDDRQIASMATTSFFDDYVVRSADRNVSRGFLDGLKPLVQHAGESSEIGGAMRIVAIAGAANRYGRADLLYKTKLKYGQLLQSFRRALLHAEPGRTMEWLMTAALLGIYEV
jgi:hypothetical protein